MRQALHIFRKDLRRGWPMLLIWAAVLAVLSQPLWVDPLDVERVPRTSGAALPFLLAIAGMIVVALVVQYDSLVGEREFWMTRPIGPWPLMAAKALFIGLFVVLPPAAIQLTAAVRFGLSQDRWLGQFLDLALPWAAFLALAALLASVTKGLAGFSSLFLALLIGPQLVGSILDQVRGRQSGSTIPDGLISALGLAAAGLLALHYATRRRALVVFAGAIVLPLAWMHPIAYRLGSGQQPDRKLGRFNARIAPGPGRESFAIVRPESDRPGYPPARYAALLPARAEVPDAPPDWTFHISSREATIDWEDGGSSSVRLSGPWSAPSMNPPVDGFAWADGHAPRPTMSLLSIQDDAPLYRFLGRKGRLTGAGRATVLKKDIRSLPLQPGAELARGDFAGRVLEVRFDPPKIDIRVRIRKLNHAQWFEVAPVPYLANRSSGELLPLSSSSEGRPSATLPLLLSGSWPGADEHTWSADLAGVAPSLADWVAGAEALIVFYDWAGHVDVGLEETEIVVDQKIAEPRYANDAEGLAQPPLEVSIRQ